jgi:phosphomethylpyrimidine synthase
MNQLTNLPSADISAQHEQDAKDLTRILPASRKVYVEGSRPDIQVPFREISLTETPTGLGVNIILLLWFMTHQVFIPILMSKLI